MPRLAYVDGRYIPLSRAAIHVEDRALQLGDGIYEVFLAVNGRVIDLERHFDRLERSLREVRMPMPMGRAALALVMDELMRRNGVTTGGIYLQVTRGTAKREHAFPAQAFPTLILTTRPLKLTPSEQAEKGVKVITLPDIRWKRRDIKATVLLPNALAKQQAKEAGAYEALLVEDDGKVNEGAASNAWIVTKAGELLTAPADNAILNGVTRLAVLDIAKAMKLKFRERRFSVKEALAAKEVFLTGTTALVLPVVAIDGKKIGTGSPGPVTQKLRTTYLERIGVSAS